MRHRRRTAAWTASLAIHLLLGLVFVGSASGTLISGATAESSGDGIAVTLVRLPPDGASHPLTSEENPLEVLTAKLASDAPPVFVSPDHQPSSDLATLHDNLVAQSSVSPSSDRHSEGLPSPRPSDGTVAAEPARAGPAAAAPTPGSASTGSFWGQVEPCWRSMGGHFGVAVSLQVELNAKGQLAKAPIILRGNAALDDRRLSAEVAALQALSACLPQGDLRFGGQAFRLDFPPN